MSTDRPSLSSVSRELKSFSEDLLGRRNAAETLLKVVSNDSGPLVIALDSPWGTGKTSFIQMFLAECWDEETHGAKILLDAFAGDFGGDPIGTIAASIEEAAPSKNQAVELRDEKASRLRRALSGVRDALPQVSRQLVGSTLTALGGPIGKAAGELAMASISAAVTDPTARPKSTNAREEFRESLLQVVQRAPDGRVLVVVDELDRCDPEFALALLSRLKHLFDVEGLIFLLVCQFKQLESARNMQSQPKGDSEGYLSKFVHLRMSIPSPYEGDGTSIRQFCESRLSSLKLENEDRILKVLPIISAWASLSLREVERVVSTLALLERLNSAQATAMKLQSLYVAVCVVAVKRPELLKSCAKASCRTDDLFSVFSLPTDSEDNNTWEAAQVMLLCGKKEAASHYPEQVKQLESQHLDGLDKLAADTASKLRPFINRHS